MNRLVYRHTDDGSGAMIPEKLSVLEINALLSEWPHSRQIDTTREMWKPMGNLHVRVGGGKTWKVLSVEVVTPDRLGTGQ